MGCRPTVPARQCLAGRPDAQVGVWVGSRAPYQPPGQLEYSRVAGLGALLGAPRPRRRTQHAVPPGGWGLVLNA